MLTAQKISKKHLPQIKVAAKAFASQYGRDAVRASISMFSGNTVFGIFNGDEIVGWKVVDGSGRVLSEIGQTTVGNAEAPVFQRAIDPFAQFEEDVDDETVEEVLYKTPEEHFAEQLLDNAIRSDEFLRANPQVGRKQAPAGGYIPANSPAKNKPKLGKAKIFLGIVMSVLVLAGGVFSIYTAYTQLAARDADTAVQESQMPEEPDWDAYEQMPSDAIEHVQITSGDDVHAMRDKLLAAGAVSIARDFVQKVDDADAYSALQAGDYIVTGSENADSFVERLSSGKRVPAGVMGINTGDTVTTIAEAISKASLPFSGEDFLASVYDVQKWKMAYPMLAQVPDNLPSLEGYFLSDEYNLASAASADDAVRMLLDPMEAKFESYSNVSSMDFHNILTKASLIEKEALFDEDRPLISSVIDNRLAAGAPLQIDAAVKYANNYDEARVYDNHLEIDSPYNTYMYAGLPIGPICSGIADVDINAALNPAQTDFFYYVLKDTEGHHQFCVTPEEFEIAKQNYLTLFGYDEEG